MTALGKVEGGTLKLGLCAYTTVVVGFEPFYEEAFVSLLEKFARGGGSLVWNSTPPADQLGNVPDGWLTRPPIRRSAFWRIAVYPTVTQWAG